MTTKQSSENRVVHILLTTTTSAGLLYRVTRPVTMGALLGMGFILWLAACQLQFAPTGAREDDLAQVATIAIHPAQATLTPGGILQFSATPRDAHGNALNDHPVTWSSSNGNVAIVNETGLAQALADGLATISATSEGVTGEASLTVAQEQSAELWFEDTFDGYSSTEALRDECRSRGNQCLSPDQIYLDEFIAYTAGGHGKSMRFDWTNQGCTVKSIGWPRTFGGNPQSEIWIEVPFRLSSNYTPCNNACQPCAHKLLFAFSGEGFGRWQVVMGGAGRTSVVDLPITWGAQAGPFEEDTGFYVDDYTDEQWHVMRVHWRHSTTPTAGDGIGEIWIDGAKGNTLENLNTEDGAAFVAVYWGRNKDKGANQGTESVWAGSIKIWKTDPGW